MPVQNSIFQKPFFKILSVLLAFSAMTGSILFSQSNATNKKEKKEELIIYPSSKSMGPAFPKKEKPNSNKESNKNQEQTQSNPTKEIRQEKEELTEKEESKTKKKKKYPVMPSSKAPDPGSLE